MNAQYLYFFLNIILKVTFIKYKCDGNYGKLFASKEKKLSYTCCLMFKIKHQVDKVCTYFQQTLIVCKQTNCDNNKLLYIPLNYHMQISLHLKANKDLESIFVPAISMLSTTKLQIKYFFMFTFIIFFHPRLTLFITFSILI